MFSLFSSLSQTDGRILVSCVKSQQNIMSASVSCTCFSQIHWLFHMFSSFESSLLTFHCSQLSLCLPCDESQWETGHTNLQTHTNMWTCRLRVWNVRQPRKSAHVFTHSSFRLRTNKCGELDFDVFTAAQLQWGFLKEARHTIQFNSIFVAN